MIASYIDLSTSHLTRETMDLLAVPDVCRVNRWPAMTIAIYEFGAFVTVPPNIYENDQEMKNLPADLDQVFQFCRDLCVQLILFDADGATNRTLPTYDWS